MTHALHSPRYPLIMHLYALTFLHIRMYKYNLYMILHYYITIPYIISIYILIHIYMYTRVFKMR